MKRLIPLLSIAAANACAQCVMCFRTAAAQQSARAHVLNIGIVLLGVPPILILAGFCYLAWRRSQSYAERSSPAEQPERVPGVACHDAPPLIKSFPKT